MAEFKARAIDMSRVTDLELWEEFRKRGFTKTANVTVPVSLEQIHQARDDNQRFEEAIKHRAVQQLAAFLAHDEGAEWSKYEDGKTSVVHRLSVTTVQFPDKS